MQPTDREPRTRPGSDNWSKIEADVIRCGRCSRLREHCSKLAQVRRRAYIDQTYWGRPVPGFGDPRASILMLGLAPGAHGANRTGRMFTGDRSGEFLYAALHRVRLANQPRSEGRDDGLQLKRVFISAACRCAPPENKPSRVEIDHCASFLDREIELLSRMAVTIALGKIAWDTALRRAERIDPGSMPRPRPKFSHMAEVRLPLRSTRESSWLLGSYHPSQQNTQTGRLTAPMFDKMLRRALRLAD